MSPDRSATTLEQIGKYRVTGELGRGGMGIVYRGEDPLIGRAVAIKTLTEVTPELRQRFYIEARSGTLSHPNIVTVYELGEHEGSPFIAMEFINGESLEKMLRRQRRLPVADALSIVEQVAAGLGYAHGHGVVHRDVKPANILVQPDGRVTIVDFGIARLTDQTRRLTKTDGLLGTFHYIAPERLKGEPNDGRGDVWSTGVILYEMLTGELPFNGRDITSLYRVIHEPYIPLSEHLPDLPAGLEAIVARALAKRVEDRYQTAEEMAIELQAISGPLRQGRIETLLETARRLSAEQQLAGARSALMQAQRIDPANVEVKSLIAEVQERLSHLQREEQLRQLLEQVGSARGERRWDDAVSGLEQAQRLDPEGASGIQEQLDEIQELRRRQQRVSALWEQANEARSHGDLTGAEQCLGEALRIDEQSEDLRNAHAMVLRDIRRREQEREVEELLESARASYSGGRYTEAIARLRDAAEIDPAHVEVQELLFTASTRQREERRQLLLEKIAAEIRDSLGRMDFDEAGDRVRRALEAFPGEAVLLRLESETEARRRDFEVDQVVRTAMLEAQELLDESPERALAAIRRGLELAPGNETLVQAGGRLEQLLGDLQRRQARSESLLSARAAMDARSYQEAIRLLEEVIRTHGTDEDLEHLLAAARREDEGAQRRAADARRAAEAQAAIEGAVQAAERLLAASDLRRCMRPLDAVAKRQGESAVRDARQDLEKRRRQQAEQTLENAMKRARQLSGDGSHGKALRALREAEAAKPYATSSRQGEFEGIRQELRAAGREGWESLIGGEGVAIRRLAYATGAVLLAAALLTVALTRTRHEAPAPAARQGTPAPAPPQTYIEINASPWAKIVGVADLHGREVPLPSRDETTPLRLDGIVAGTYRVNLAAPGGEVQTIACSVSPTHHLCTAELGTPDVDQVLEGVSQ